MTRRADLTGRGRKLIDIAAVTLVAAIALGIVGFFIYAAVLALS
ncbi:MAG: hypothetical protein ABI112_17940 [Terracoccus sp.]